MPAPGWWNGDTPDTIKDGFEYCMAANIAHRAGLDQLKVVNVAWDALVAGQTKDFDLALSQISITDERKKVVDFSVPYFSSDIGVMVKTGTQLESESMKDQRIGVQQATTGADFVASVLKPNKPAKVFPDTPSMFTALQAGQIDASMTDTAIVLGRRILPPAEDEAVQRRLLNLLSGRRHHCLSAVCVIDGNGRARTRISDTIVAFKRLSAAEVDRYVACGEGLGKAGGYAIQGRAEAFVRFLSGSHSGVIGLPLFETRALLEAAGVSLG